MAKNQERWAACRLKLWAVIADVRYEVVQFAASFELNTIPLASLSLAVGRNVDTNKAAKIHEKFDDLAIRDKVKVYLHVTTLGDAGRTPNDWGPAEEKAGVVIFDGYVIGTGWQRGVNGAQFTVHLQHWLADLHYSSAVSGLSHPGNPSDWTYPAVFEPMNMTEAGGGGAGDDPWWVPHTVLERNGATIGALEDDFFLKVLKPWMQEVSSREPIDQRLLDIVGGGGANKIATAALDRMKQDGDYPVKLGLKLDGDAGQAIADGINKHLRWTVGYNAVNTTLWGKLVGEWAPAYWFAVVPRVDNALVVPFAGALSGTPYCTIRTSEYDAADLSGRMLQNLRCVGILHSLEYRAGGNTNPAEMQADRSGLAGLFPDPPKTDGVVLLKDAPPWLADPVLEHAYSRAAQGLKDNGPVQTAGVTKGEGPKRDPDRDPTETQGSFQSITNQLAHAWFSVEKLKGRAGELSGRLRFDVAPGSQVKVECGSDVFLRKDGLGRPIYATVMRVSTIINAESQKAGTSFTLAWLRNEKENSDSETAVDVPPLYKEKWAGGNLVDGFKAPYT